MYYEHEFKLQPETPLFSDAGMIPGGGSWLTPTDAFLELWERAGRTTNKERVSIASRRQGNRRTTRPRRALEENP